MALEEENGLLLLLNHPVLIPINPGLLWTFTAIVGQNGYGYPFICLTQVPPVEPPVEPPVSYKGLQH